MRVSFGGNRRWLLRVARLGKSASRTRAVPRLRAVTAAGARVAGTATTGAGDPMKTTPQRADERRQEKLAAVHEQIDAGTLTIRRMTVMERAEHPRPRPEGAAEAGAPTTERGTWASALPGARCSDLGGRARPDCSIRPRKPRVCRPERTRAFPARLLAEAGQRLGRVAKRGCPGIAETWCDVRNRLAIPPMRVLLGAGTHMADAGTSEALLSRASAGTGRATRLRT